jgi:hypothetical protein
MPSLDESNRISLKFKIYEISFGDATGKRRPPNMARTFPKRSIRRGLGDGLGDAARERRPPKEARTKHVPKRSIRRGLGDETGDALKPGFESDD